MQTRRPHISGGIFHTRADGGDRLRDSAAAVGAGAQEAELDGLMERFILYERELSALGEEQGRNLIARVPA